MSHNGVEHSSERDGEHLAFFVPFDTLFKNFLVFTPEISAIFSYKQFKLQKCDFFQFFENYSKNKPLIEILHQIILKAYKIFYKNVSDIFSLKVEEKPEKAFEISKPCDGLLRRRSRRRNALSPAQACFVF